MSLYPPVGFYFNVAFDFAQGDMIDTQFSEVSGISSSLDTESVAEGGENRFVHTLPSRPNYANLILKRGLSIGSTLQDWCLNAIENLDISPAMVWVSLLNEAGEPLMTWSFHGAYPVKWEVADLNAQQSQVLIETLELSYQYFKRES
uniref:phage tail protein n=1 Tax=Ningiella ruwaisensis TaxID=2364274 RepID=UPI00109F4130|nr:phage tail protein [Ningiella ruwaisensis]